MQVPAVINIVSFYGFGIPLGICAFILGVFRRARARCPASRSMKSPTVRMCVCCAGRFDHVAGLAFGSPTWGVFGLYTGMVTSVWTMTVCTVCSPVTDSYFLSDAHSFARI